MTQTFHIEIHAHIADSETVFEQPDFKRKVINALQGVLQAEGEAVGLSPQEAWEAFSVIPGSPDVATQIVGELCYSPGQIEKQYPRTTYLSLD